MVGKALEYGYSFYKDSSNKIKDNKTCFIIYLY